MPDTLRPAPLSPVPLAVERPEVAPLLLSAADLAREMGVSVRTIRRLDIEGRLPAPVRIGRAVRWIRNGPTGIVAWIAAGAPSRLDWDADHGL